MTGATGFIGGNVVRALVSGGHQAKALVRPGSTLINLEGTGVETALGDLTDRPSIASALDGCDAVVHCAAVYSFWSRSPNQIYQVNVEGTRNVLEEAARARVDRVVYTSTVSTVKFHRDRPATEEDRPEPNELTGHYKKSKYMAEKAVLEEAEKGLPAVVVNPTYPVGPWDVKPTPSGRVVVDFLKGRTPAYVNTGLNVVDVEDVAKGHVLALERGRVGERYLLGNRNMSLREILGTLAEITGRKPPRIRIPFWVGYGGGTSRQPGGIRTDEAGAGDSCRSSQAGSKAHVRRLLQSGQRVGPAPKSGGRRLGKSSQVVQGSQLLLNKRIEDG